jgi:hypothetical protein
MLGAKPLRVALLPRSAPLPLHGLRLSVPCESGSENREETIRLILLSTVPTSPQSGATNYRKNL